MGRPDKLRRASKPRGRARGGVAEVSFKDAVRATPGLENAYQRGLQGLDPLDRERVTAANPQQLCGSVNLDRALRTGAQANEHVWDYGVCYTSDARRIHWIEVHPASDHGVTDLLTKFAWLKGWLAGECRRLKPSPVYVWISSGKTTFTKTSPAARRLAADGVISAGAHYHLR